MIIERLRHFTQGIGANEISTPPTLTAPVSQTCTQAQMDEKSYAYWCGQIGEPPRYHRKQWEFCYILQGLACNGALAPGKRGLGFGVGEEPLASLFAQRGCEIVATDLARAVAQEKGWVETAQHAENKAALNMRNICPEPAFGERVSFEFMDMNLIPQQHYGKFDFCWSACAFEHLGSISLGLEFVINSVKCLKPGGVAVHTTELNCDSDDITLDNDDTVLFRKRDFRELSRKLKQMGCVTELNFDLGDLPGDHHVDVAPYRDNGHLKLKIAQWTSTSFGLIVRKL